MRIVLDTNILARAASGPPSPAAELLKLCLATPHVLCVSPFLISELSRVLRYERVRRMHGMPDEAIDQFLQDLQSASLTVELPEDAGAAVLCTLDRHIRTASVVAHCARQGVEVLTDIELLARLRPATP